MANKKYEERMQKEEQSKSCADGEAKDAPTGVAPPVAAAAHDTPAAPAERPSPPEAAKEEKKEKKELSSVKAKIRNFQISSDTLIRQSKDSRSGRGASSSSGSCSRSASNPRATPSGGQQQGALCGGGGNSGGGKLAKYRLAGGNS